MKKLSLTNYTAYPNLVVLLRGLTLNPEKVIIIDESQECLLSFLGPYLSQMQCEYKFYKKPISQDTLINYNPKIIICFCFESDFAEILHDYYNRKNVIIVQVLNNNFQIDEYKIPLLKIEMYNRISKQRNVVYLNNPEQCQKDIIRLNNYVMVGVQ